MDKNSPEYKEAIREHAKTLGLDPDNEPQYLWIVEEALTAPVPDDWEQGETDDGTIYYFNVNTEESIWEHPMDSHYSEMIKTKRAEDAKKKTETSKKSDIFNNAKKVSTPVPTNVAVVEEFDMDGEDEPKPFKREQEKRPITTNTTKLNGFGKDSQSWLLDDEEDFPVQSTFSSKVNIVSAIKRQDDIPPKATVVMSKPYMNSQTISPVPATSFQPPVQQTAFPVPVSSVSNGIASAATKELEKQVESLKQEITQLKRDRDTSEKTERQAKADLRREIESLQRGKEQAEVEAKESNYLRMKVNELKAKVTAMESKKEGDSSLYKTISDLETKLEVMTREFHDRERVHSKTLADVEEKNKDLNKQLSDFTMKEKKWTETSEKHDQEYSDLERALKKKEDELRMKLKEHSIEIDELKEQLLIRQATNINLQHSAGDIDRLKKKSADQENELRQLQSQLSEQTSTIASLRAALETNERTFEAQLDAEQKKRTALEQILKATKDTLDEAEREKREIESISHDAARQKQDIEYKLKTMNDDADRLRSQLDDMTGKLRIAEDKERGHKDLEKEVRVLQDKLHSAAFDRDEYDKSMRRQKEEHVHVQTKLQQEIEEMRRDRERGHVQANEVAALKKEIETLNIDIVRLRDQKSNGDFEFRNLKQAMSLEASQLLQYKAQVEEYTRKDFLEKQRYELLHNEKSAVEKKLMSIEAQIQTMRSETRTETDKYLFRIQELESLNARYEYDISRADEKFANAEKWRVKEANRVEQRDAELLEMKEELGRLKARNIEGENHHLINELRTANRVLEVQVKELKTQLQDESATKSQVEKHWTQEAEHLKKQLHAQIPQLAAAATQRASDEWKRRCDEIVNKIKSEYEENWLMEKQKTNQRESHWYDEKRELEQQVKLTVSEKDFLNKEISRLEDNNKHLMEQLHTIRVYLTQRPIHSAPPSMIYTPQTSNPEIVGSQHLQHQLGILHAQFQQLFEHTTAPPPPPQKSRFEREPEGRSVSDPYKSTNTQSLEEKQHLIRSMEEIGSAKQSGNWVPVVEPVHDTATSWYRKDYWRSNSGHKCRLYVVLDIDSQLEEPLPKPIKSLIILGPAMSEPRCEQVHEQNEKFDEEDSNECYTPCDRLVLPPLFLDFIREHGINPKVYDVNPNAMPRYFRTKDASIGEDELRKHFPEVKAVSWLSCFYSIPSTYSLATSELYLAGKVYGMEASSGYAVNVLNPQPGDHVLDLCCAPGAKLTMLADVLKKQGSVTGVDFSKARISACRSLVHKYNLIHTENSTSTSWRCRLFHADGRTFNVLPCSNDTTGVLETVFDSTEVLSRSQKTMARKRMNKSARARLLKQAKESTPILEDSSMKYDKVLVDAECTHDGSLRHLVKMKTEAEWHEYLDKYLNSKHVQGILDLQHDLIRNGFRLLKEERHMVYSTCSLSLKQNEEIVESFLNDTPEAKLVPFDTKDVPHQPGHIPHTIRFTPLENMGGLYIALFTKVKVHKRHKSNSDE